MTEVAEQVQVAEEEDAGGLEQMNEGVAASSLQQSECSAPEADPAPASSNDDAAQTKASLQQNVAEEYLPGAASLLEQLDKRIMIVLRDGRHLVGKLRSFDQFMSLILEETCERVLLPGKFCDFPLGLYIVRGDNIVLLGEIEGDDSEATGTLQRIDQEAYIEIAAEGDVSEFAGKVVWDFE